MQNKLMKKIHYTF